MNDITKAVKDNGPVTALLALVLAGGGFNFVSESEEDQALEELEQELRDADIIQNSNHNDLVIKYNELDKEIALLKQWNELMSERVSDAQIDER